MRLDFVNQPNREARKAARQCDAQSGLSGPHLFNVMLGNAQAAAASAETMDHPFFALLCAERRLAVRCSEVNVCLKRGTRAMGGGRVGSQVLSST